MPARRSWGRGSRRRSGGFVGGFALTWAGFSAASAAAGQMQADGVAASIQLWAGGLVGAFMLLSVSVMFFYPLTEERFREITEEITARRATEV
ncbi:hypothetical protein EXU48_06840 [Occultella glacieicola]|uniref:Uncharacterized protein n=1 Tax=Occultella glacieicola TaxID=2518684 RepID=A0ABY2E5U4_9MICO|nr:hypothetical protein [Occultella glacieicola]TDE95960.1 hypothetical protein EXU48_06840 [Occultella glacieicola]